MTQVNLSSDAMTLEQDEATEAIGAARRVIRGVFTQTCQK